MNINNVKLDFDDILIVPSKITHIKSRSDVDIYYPDGKLPLITAPMDTVVSAINEHYFYDNNILVCLPRGEKSDGCNSIESYSLMEIKEVVNGKQDVSGGYLIDIANGHMNELVEVVRGIKNDHGDGIYLIVGSIANPNTYKILSDVGADAIRVGIGNGNGCLTTQNTGVGYPMASLIKECYDESCKLRNPAKIIADGGMKDYADIIKALALGADFVMIGSIFNKSLESCADTYIGNKKHETWVEPGNVIDQYSDVFKQMLHAGTPFYKKFRGMSTKAVQRKWNRADVRTSEGITKLQKVEYTLSQWVENFEHYLSSAMSYTNASKLSEFIGIPEIINISQNSLIRFKK